MAWKLHRLVLATLYLAGLGTIAYFAVRGFDYYRTPLIERPRHELYWDFKPGGTLGLKFGIAGAGMMTLMLGYSLRKRWYRLRKLGPARMWLDYHIFLGVCGPLFIVLHSSFKVGGLVGLSFWSMVGVALSGVFGRYLYRKLARGVTGEERLRTERLFHYWHVFHKPFAIIMFLFMVVHIGVAWWTGYV